MTGIITQAADPDRDPAVLEIRTPIQETFEITDTTFMYQ